MQKTLVAILLTLVSKFLTAQTTVEYYSDKFLRKHVPEQKAKFIRQMTFDTASQIFTEKVIRTHENKVIKLSGYKGNEPVGQWVDLWKNELVTLDYNFDLRYRDIADCTEKEKTFIPKANGERLDPLMDIPGQHYTAPVPNVSIQEATKQMFYPAKAVDEGIMGTVAISFRLEADGSISDMAVSKGVHPLLDKEALRIFRKISFKTPAMVGGKPVAICLLQKLSFRLE